MTGHSRNQSRLMRTRLNHCMIDLCIEPTPSWINLHWSSMGLQWSSMGSPAWDPNDPPLDPQWFSMGSPMILIGSLMIIHGIPNDPHGIPNDHPWDPQWSSWDPPWDSRWSSMGSPMILIGSPMILIGSPMILHGIPNDPPWNPRWSSIGSPMILHGIPNDPHGIPNDPHGIPNDPPWDPRWSSMGSPMIHHLQQVRSSGQWWELITLKEIKRITYFIILSCVIALCASVASYRRELDQLVTRSAVNRVSARRTLFNPWALLNSTGFPAFSQRWMVISSRPYEFWRYPGRYSFAQYFTRRTSSFTYRGWLPTKLSWCSAREAE